jgi:putative transcriptional regulator
MIRNHLSRLLGERKWTQADLARRTGIRPSTINDIYHEVNDGIRIEHLDKICRILDCKVSDFLEYIPDDLNGF